MMNSYEWRMPVSWGCRHFSVDTTGYGMAVVCDNMQKYKEIYAYYT